MKQLILAVVVAAIVGVVAFVRRTPSLPTTSVDAKTAVATISRGETVNIEDHLEPGVWTVVEFTADW